MKNRLQYPPKMRPKKSLSLSVLTLLVFILGAGVAVCPVFGADPVTPAASAVPVPGGDSAAEPVEDVNSITLDFKEADINTVLRVLSLKSRMNIVAGPEVQGTVTIRLENVAWDKALEVVLRTYDYVYERSDNIIRVTTRDKMAQETVVTQTFILNYTKASEIEAAVKDILTERGRIKVAERTNMVVITDIPTNLYRIGEVILKLDKITPQAFIDSKIVKTDVGIAENLGVEWKTGGNNNLGSLTGSKRPVTFPFAVDTEDEKEDIAPQFEQFFPLISQAASLTDAGKSVANPFDTRSFPQPAPSVASHAFTFGTLDYSAFNTVLQMLKSKSNTKVVSNPRIVVLNNQTAKVQVGQQIPLPTFERNKDTGSVEVTGFKYRDVGVILNVTPHINSEEEILVELKPEVSATGATIDFGEFQVPSFDITTALTQVLIRSGETIAIGGLLTDNVQLAESRIPYLSDIPVFGKVFRSKRQTAGTGNAKVETLFFVTVSIIDTEGQPAGTLLRAKGQSKPGFQGTSKGQGGGTEKEKVGAREQTKATGQAAPAVTPSEPSAAQTAAAGTTGSAQ